MIGSYTAYVLQELFAAYLPGYLDYYFILALPLSIVTAGCVGLLMERGILRFLYGRPLESLLITWGHWHGAATGGAALFRRSNERQPADLVPRRLGSHAGAHFPLQPAVHHRPVGVLPGHGVRAAVPLQRGFAHPLGDAEPRHGRLHRHRHAQG